MPGNGRSVVASHRVAPGSLYVLGMSREYPDSSFVVALSLGSDLSILSTILCDKSASTVSEGAPDVSGGASAVPEGASAGSFVSSLFAVQ